jgi:hypothetical protein
MIELQYNLSNTLIYNKMGRGKKNPCLQKLQTGIWLVVKEILLQRSHYSHYFR